MSWLGIDIGGANIKVADGDTYAVSAPFALWRHPESLADKLQSLIADAPTAENLAITMTGELADCFETKEQGVAAILDSVQSASAGRTMRVYRLDGTFVDHPVAAGGPSQVAAANWHALSRFVGRYAPHSAILLIDIGSTTTDLIPINCGQPLTSSTTDTERLLSGELVYTGVERTPVCAIVQAARYRGEICPLAREFFATTSDVYVILGDLEESPSCLDTADGRPLTKAASRNRLGRMFCADSTNFHHRDAIVLAETVATQQASSLATAIQRVLDRTQLKLGAFVLSGHADHLALRAIKMTGMQIPVVSLSKELNADIARCAPAHAVAVLAREEADV